MSFILDALRKSDAERQRAATPGLADVRYARRQSRRNIWLPVLVVVLIANIAFMAVQWFNRNDQPPATSVEAGTDIAGTTSDSGVPGSTFADPKPQVANTRPLARESEFDELRPSFTPERDAPALETPVRTISEPAPAISTEPASDTSPAVRQATGPVADQANDETAADKQFPRILQGDALPTAEQLIAAGSLDIPMLNLDLHVYSNQPATRFVVINSRKYREGDKLSEGPTVESITKDGVVLSNQGRRFALTRK